MTDTKRIAKILGLLTLTAVIGGVSLQSIPQSTAINLQGAAATFESDSDQNIAELYSYDSYIESHGKTNVRGGPGTNYDVNYVVDNGSAVTLLNDKTGNDGYRWYYLKFDEYAFTGWIREDLLLIPNELQEAQYEKDHYSDTQYPEQYVILDSQYSNSRINVRSGPGTNYGVRHYGLNGDPVEILDSSVGHDKYLWYELRFVQSRAKGWVREDLLSFIAD